MASRKKSKSTRNPAGKKKARLRDLPKAKKELTEQEARAVKGGFFNYYGKAALDED